MVTWYQCSLWHLLGHPVWCQLFADPTSCHVCKHLLPVHSDGDLFNGPSLWPMQVVSGNPENQSHFSLQGIPFPPRGGLKVAYWDYNTQGTLELGQRSGHGFPLGWAGEEHFLSIPWGFSACEAAGAAGRASAGPPSYILGTEPP